MALSPHTEKMVARNAERVKERNAEERATAKLPEPTESGERVMLAKNDLPAMTLPQTPATERTPQHGTAPREVKLQTPPPVEPQIEAGPVRSYKVQTKPVDKAFTDADVTRSGPEVTPQQVYNSANHAEAQNNHTSAIIDRNKAAVDTAAAEAAVKGINFQSKMNPVMEGVNAAGQIAATAAGIWNMVESVKSGDFRYFDVNNFGGLGRHGGVLNPNYSNGGVNWSTGASSYGNYNNNGRRFGGNNTPIDPYAYLK